MDLLLDTHAFLWAIDNDPRLSQKARDAITDGHNIVFVSAATAWEMSIKKAIGKLKVPQYLGLRHTQPLDLSLGRTAVGKPTAIWGQGRFKNFARWMRPAAICSRRP